MAFNQKRAKKDLGPLHTIELSEEAPVSARIERVALGESRSANCPTQG
jgi:hypothetical protein